MPTKKHAKKRPPRSSIAKSKHPICPHCGMRHRPDAKSPGGHYASAKRGTRNVAEGKESISASELAALRELKKERGNKWKSLLREMWSNGSYRRYGYERHAGDLQRLRNRLGPSWLNAFRIDAARAQQNPRKTKRRSAKRNPSPAGRVVISEKSPRIELKVKHDADWDDWVVRVYRDGKSVERLSYHAYGDKADALDTLKAMAEDYRKVFANLGDIPPPIRGVWPIRPPRPTRTARGA